MQKKKERDTLQSLVGKKNTDLKNANELIKKSKQANQKEQKAIEEDKSRHAKSNVIKKKTMVLN